MFSAIWAISENKLHSMRLWWCPLCTRPKRLVLVLAHWKNSHIYLYSLKPLLNIGIEIHEYKLKYIKRQRRKRRERKNHKHIHEYMSKSKHDKLNNNNNNKIIIKEIVNKRHTCHDDIGSEHT